MVVEVPQVQQPKWKQHPSYCLIFNHVVARQIWRDFLALKPGRAFFVEDVSFGTMGVQIKLWWSTTFLLTPTQIAIPTGRQSVR